MTPKKKLLIIIVWSLVNIALTMGFLMIRGMLLYFSSLSFYAMIACFFYITIAITNLVALILGVERYQTNQGQKPSFLMNSISFLCMILGFTSFIIRIILY